MGDNPSLSGTTGRVKEFVRSERGSSKPESKGTNKGAVSTAAAKGSKPASSVSSSSTQAKVKQGSSQTTTATAVASKVGSTSGKGSASSSLAQGAAVGTATTMGSVKPIVDSSFHKYTGGAHKNTKIPKNDGLDSHHCPAKDCYKNAKISPEQGPAIKMEPSDHRKTGSYGRTPDAIEYREKQRELLNNGKLIDAINMDIQDIKLKFGDKYDKEIDDMLKYAEELNPNDFKNN